MALAKAWTAKFRGYKLCVFDNQQSMPSIKIKNAVIDINIFMPIWLLDEIRRFKNKQQVLTENIQHSKSWWQINFLVCSPVGNGIQICIFDVTEIKIYKT